MRTRTATLFSALALLLSAPLAAESQLENLAQTALRGSAPAIEALRKAGPEGMNAMLAVACPGAACTEEEETAIDRVCGVRNCRDIRLFWYTDLEAAKAAARAENKPILSLRLMGRLDEEFSCANSRFFRTVFYKNRAINELLRDRYVLHWRSVRPVPKVTIDFGDGARLERTITGNSIHYVLDSRGRLLEALPGLYGPDAFQRSLEEGARVAPVAARFSDANLVSWVTARHQRALMERASDFRSSRNNAGGLETGSKRSGEISLLAALANVTDDQLREQAEQRRSSVHLDPESRAFLLRKQGVTDPAEADKLIDAFETTVALDEVINEYRTGPAILQQLSDPEYRKNLDLEAFNLWVYAEVFRAPLNDPWMGLAPAGVYVALPASTRTAAKQP